MRDFDLNIENFELTPFEAESLSRLEKFKEDWRLLKETEPGRIVKLQKKARILSSASSVRIYGASFSDREATNFLKGFLLPSFFKRKQVELFRYAKTLYRIQTIGETKPLTSNYVKQFHDALVSFGGVPTTSVCCLTIL